MCGIFGNIGDPLAPPTIARVCSVLRHRGPESSGAVALPGAQLVHTRLKIIDLSPAGAQPMANEDDTVWVTFNGEIYNFAGLRRELEAEGHRFRSQTDTEVIVHGYEQWGESVVERLDGMFAFGIWDVPRRRLLLARDRAGKKPLFYGSYGGHFLFGSEVKALFAAGMVPDIDHAGVAGLLAYGYVPPPDSLYEGVHQLPPAHRLVLTPGKSPQISRYWQVSFSSHGPQPSETEAIEGIRHLLTEAVRKRMVADVPVGAFLSGGLDSTIIVGLMAQQSARVRTFSIGFSGDARYDETHYARQAALAFGTEHTQFEVTPRDFQLVDKLVWHHDGPFGDSSAIPTYVVSRLTRAEVTVALSGDGGDELFAGYLRFWAAANTERIPAPLRRLAGLSAPLLPGGTGSRTFIARARRFLSAIDQPLGDRLTFWNSFFAFTHADLLRPELRPPRDATLAFHRGFFKDTNGASPLAAALDHNFGAYLPHDLLVKTDRMSMAHALETRSPFLDTALVEYVAPLPDSYKLRGWPKPITKYILRRAFADLMPPEIRTRGKMGFGLPLGTWFRTDLRSYVEERLLPSDARINRLLRPEVVRQVIREHVSGQADHEQQIWLLLTMELWLRNLPRLSGAWEDADVSAAGLAAPRTAAVVGVSHP